MGARCTDLRMRPDRIIRVLRTTLRRMHGRLRQFVNSLQGYLAPATDAPATSGRSAEKQRGEFRQVAAPDHPGVHAGSFDVGVFDALAGEPRSEIPIYFNLPVGSA